MPQHVSPQHATNANTNSVHLYSTVVKPSHHSNGSIEHVKHNGGVTVNGAASQSSNGSNYASLLSTTSGGFNPSPSHPNIANSNNIGLPSVPPSSMTHHHLNHQSSMVNSYSASLRPKDTFVANPYLRTSSNIITTSNGSIVASSGLPLSNYNVDSNERLLSSGAYNASQPQQHNRYKTNSLGGGSSSSGVISNGGSSPGHSPVGSVSGQASGTHV